MGLRLFQIQVKQLRMYLSSKAEVFPTPGRALEYLTQHLKNKVTLNIRMKSLKTLLKTTILLMGLVILWLALLHIV